MTGFLGFTERKNFGNALYPIIPLGEVQNFNLLQVDKWQPDLGLPFSAWSVSRRLWSGYTGNLIEVRRSSDNATLNIGYDSNNELDVATLLGFVGAGSGFIRTIYDQSGASNNFTQTVIANQPRIVNAGVLDTVNGKPSAFFDGTNDAMTVASSTATYNWMHNLTDANNDALLLSVCQFGTSSNPNAAYALLGNNAFASTSIGFLMVFDDRASIPINNSFRTQITHGVLASFVVNMTTADKITPNQLNAVSANTNRAATPELRSFGFVNQTNAFNNNLFNATPTNSNASFSLQLGANGNNGNNLLGYVSELFFYRRPFQEFRSLTPYNKDLQTYYSIP